MAPPVLAITGATGFIGQAVLRAACQDGWQPRLLVRRFPRACLAAGSRIDIVLGDLDDAAGLRELVTGAAAVIHLAGLIKALNRHDFFVANADGTARLLEAADAANAAAAIIHVSSLAAREPRLSPYAASKAAGEDCVRQLAGDKSWVIIRPPAVYGPGDPATLPLFKAAAMGFLPYPAAADARLSLIHVHDLARAILAVARQLVAGTLPSGFTVELDDGHAGGYRWDEIIQALAQAVGHPVRSMRLPRGLLWPIAAANGLRGAVTHRPEVLTIAKLAELYHPNWGAGDARLPAKCDWRPEFTLEKGFSDTIDWYRKHSFIS
ncbi:MAG TPA: NAD-dependent epimerase/dehydratase family protein [Dongiaceae bacterium]